MLNRQYLPIIILALFLLAMGISNEVKKNNKLDEVNTKINQVEVKLNKIDKDVSYIIQQLDNAEITR